MTNVAEISEEQLEAQRKGVIKSAVVSFAAAAVSFPVYYLLIRSCGLAESFFDSQSTDAAAASCVTLALLFEFFVFRAKRRFVENFKAKYVLAEIGAIPGFSELEYRSRDGFSWEEIRDSTIVRCGDRSYFKREDLVLGVFSGTAFRISDVTTQRMEKHEKKEKLRTLFSGQVVCFERFDAVKESRGLVQVFKKEIFTDIGGRRARCKINTESAAFNSQFNVFADDEHNAFYILTPQLVEKIMEFAKSAGCAVALAFNGQKLYAAAQRRGMFSPSLFAPVKAQIKLVAEDVAILRAAAELLLNQSGFSASDKPCQ